MQSATKVPTSCQVLQSFFGPDCATLLERIGCMCIVYGCITEKLFWSAFLYENLVDFDFQYLRSAWTINPYFKLSRSNQYLDLNFLILHIWFKARILERIGLKWVNGTENEVWGVEKMHPSCKEAWQKELLLKLKSNFQWKGKKCRTSFSYNLVFH